MKKLIYLATLMLFISVSLQAGTEPTDKGKAKSAHPASKEQPQVKAFDTSQFKGVWKNQRGSYLDIAKLENNEFRGLFTTAVADTKSCIGQPVEVVGFVNGNTLSLSLSMESCGSPVVISMVGTINENMELETFYMVQAKGGDTWKSRAFNRDIYTKQGMKNH